MKLRYTLPTTFTSTFTRSFALIALAVAPWILTGADCADNSDPFTAQPLKEGALVAHVKGGAEDGQFDASDATSIVSGGFYKIKATTTGLKGEEHVIDIQFPSSVTVPQTYSVGTDPNVVISYCVQVGTQCSQYFTDQSSGTGSLTITQVTPTVKGTFSAIAHLRPSVGTDTVRTLTSGEFNAKK